MQRKGYAKEAARAVRDWTFENTPFTMIFSYMKYTNLPSARSAMSWGCRQVDEFEDKENEITKVFAITREEWLALKQKFNVKHYVSIAVLEWKIFDYRGENID